MPNYKHGKIYKIVNDIDDFIYIGSTCLALNMRMIYHRKRAKKNNNANLYKHMVKIGIYCFKIILIRNVSCNNKEELLREEWIEYNKCDKNVLLHQLRPIVTDEEKHVESIQRRKNYFDINKDAIYERNRKYYKNNKEAVAKRMKEYSKNTMNTTK